jgi:hypothetical protein
MPGSAGVRCRRSGSATSTSGPLIRVERGWDQEEGAIEGHSKIQTTFDVYGHLLPGSHDEVRERMDAYLAADGITLAESSRDA